MKNSKISFTKSLRRFHNYNRRRIRICRDGIFGSLRAVFMTLALFGITLGSPGIALASNLPVGAEVVSGQVNILQTSPQAMQVMQDSQSAIVNWASFDIGKDALVNIVQPNVDAALLSRVVGDGLSEIHGSLNANGHLYLINPNGILFGKDSQVNVHALIASTLDLADADFLTGNLSFNGESEASVMNLGSIKAHEFAALIGGDLENAGSLAVPGGTAALLAGDATLEIGEAAGGKISLDLSGLLSGTSSNSGSIDVSSDSVAGGRATILGGSVSSAGSIDASGVTGGGEVLIGGDYLGSNADLSNSDYAKLSGSVSANALESGDAGRVILWSDVRTDFTGSIKALGGNGFVETSSKENLQASGVVLAPGGEWLLDPNNIEIVSGSTNANITGSFESTNDSAQVGADNIVAALNAGTSVNVQTQSAGTNGQAGNITVSESIDVSPGSSDPTLTLTASGDIIINDSIESSGDQDLNVVFSAGGNVEINRQVDTKGGDFTSSGVNFTNNGLGFLLTTGGNVNVNHTGAVNVNGQVATSGGSFSSQGSSFVNPQSIDTDGGAFTLTHSGAITISSSIDTSGGSGTVSLNGSSTLDIDNSITTGTGGMSINDTTGAISLNGAVSAGAGGSLDFGDNPVTLESSVSIQSSGSGGITFGSTLDGDGDSDTLTITTGTGIVTFAGNVGSTTPINNLSVTQSGGIVFGDTTYAANTQSYDAGGSSNNFSFNSGAATTITASNSLGLSNGTVSLSDGSNLSVTSGSGTLSIAAINGTSDEDVSLDAGTGSISVGSIGNGAGINDITLSATGGVTLTGDIIASDNGADDASLSISGGVTLGGGCCHRSFRWRRC